MSQVLQLTMYVAIGALLAWPAWKLMRRLLCKTGWLVTEGRCLQAYKPSQSDSSTSSAVSLRR